MPRSVAAKNYLSDGSDVFGDQWDEEDGTRVPSIIAGNVALDLCVRHYLGKQNVKCSVWS